SGGPRIGEAVPQKQPLRRRTSLPDERQFLLLNLVDSLSWQIGLLQLLPTMLDIGLLKDDVDEELAAFIEVEKSSFGQPLTGFKPTKQLVNGHHALNLMVGELSGAVGVHRHSEPIFPERHCLVSLS